MKTVSSARNPGWADQTHSTLNLWVIFEENKDSGREEGISISANDQDPQVVALFNRAVAGEFGVISEPTRH
nr:hypothetical protein [Pseudomonas viridiflava]